MMGGVTVTLVQTDARGRATIGHPERRFKMTELNDGAIILEPAVLVSEAELKFLRNIELQAQIEYARAHPEQAIERPTRGRRRDK